MATNVTSNLTSPPPPPPGAPNFRVEYVNPVDPSTATAIYFMCGIVIVCVLMGIAYKEYQGRRHNERQRTLAYLLPYLPRDSSKGLVVFDDGDEDNREVGGGGKKAGKPMAALLEEDVEAVVGDDGYPLDQFLQFPNQQHFKAVLTELEKLKKKVITPPKLPGEQRDSGRVQVDQLRDRFSQEDDYLAGLTNVIPTGEDVQEGAVSGEQEDDSAELVPETSSREKETYEDHL